MLPRKKPKKAMATVKPVVLIPWNMNVSKKDVVLAKAMAVTAIGDLFPYVRSVRGPRMIVPASVVIS